METGFFTLLFTKLIALLSAFCIVPAPVPPNNFAQADDIGTQVVAEAPGVAAPAQRAPFVVRVIQRQIAGAVGIGGALAAGADGVTFSVIAIPRELGSALGSGGVAALPGGVADAADGMLDAVDTATIGLTEAFRQAILAQLALFGGGVVNPEVAVTAPLPTRAGPLELVVRLPLALAIAGVDLAGAVARATITVTGAVVTAVTDIVEAAIPAPTQPEETERVGAALEERRLSLPEAIAQAPTTISDGFTRAGRELQGGVQRARTDFRNTLLGTATERAQVSDDNSVLRAGVSADDDTNVARLPEVTRPTRPRPVLGAVKTVTGTLKAVRDGLRTALGLPPRRSDPAAQNASVGADANVDAAGS
jgi:hypothetical protein